MLKALIAPSVLSCDFLRLGEEIRDVDSAGADMIHIDVMDGHFVPNITIGPLLVEAAKKATAKPLDVHLMIECPDKYVVDFARAGADMIAIHVEAERHHLRTIDLIKGEGKKAGIALNPSTPLSTLEYIIDEVDLVVIMTVNPGFGGQRCIPSMAGKIRAARDMIAATGRDIELEVDGGVKAGNARDIVEAGASILVMGTEIFKSVDYRQRIDEIRQRIAG